MHEGQVYQWVRIAMAMFYVHCHRHYSSEYQVLRTKSGDSAVVLTDSLWAPQWASDWPQNAGQDGPLAYFMFFFRDVSFRIIVNLLTHQVGLMRHLQLYAIQE